MHNVQKCVKKNTARVVLSLQKVDIGVHPPPHTPLMFWIENTSEVIGNSVHSVQKCAKKNTERGVTSTSLQKGDIGAPLPLYSLLPSGR